MANDAPLSTEDEHALVRRARWGDGEAFARLYRAHVDAVHALAWRMTGNRAAADDITQDTFLRMSRFLNGLRADTPLRPWLRRVATNLAVDRLRREAGRNDALPDLLEDPAGAAPEQASEFEGLLRRLPPLARTVLWLNLVEGWSHAEIGERFGRTASWSKSIASRAVARLRQALDGGEAP
jgi:RNA polymerase sigma factor (sigma-70 family)